jgi:hypothetical protein
VSSQIAVCYLFLLVFSWVYLGDDIYLRIPSLGIEQQLFAPFKSLKWVMYFYGFIGLFSFLVAIVGTVILQLASFCADTAPKLYTFSLFLVCFYWIMFFITFLYTVKLFFGKTIGKFLEERSRVESQEEVEERVFKKHFQQFDVEVKHQISREDFPKLLQVLGIFVPEEEVNQLMDTLDAEKSGFLEENVVYNWFKEITKEDDEDKKDLENISEGDESEGNEKNTSDDEN